MPTLTPIVSAMSSNLRLLAGSVDAKFEGDQSARNHRYAFNESFLNNRVYRLAKLGGFREEIFQDAFDLACTPELRLVGAYNPVPAIVAAYQNVFRGSFGQEIKVADEVNDEPVNPKLLDGPDSPVAKVWRWSDLDTEKHLMQEWAANLGTVGLRIISENDNDVSKKRVFVELDHPAVISDFDTDLRGNVTAVELKYKARGGDMGDRRDVDVVEVLTKDRFVKEVDGRNVLTADEAKNELGVCPYVILRHRHDGGQFGKWAYAGSEDTIHWINWLIVNQGESVMESVWAQWFAAAGGPPPEEFAIGRRKIAYVKMVPDTPPPIFEPLVAPLNHEGVKAYWMELIDRLHERQPEMAIVAMKVLSGQSGETIAKLQVQAESAIKRARAQYEHAMIRALQIAMSEGVRMGLWDLGTGTGTAEAADKAYQDGLEDFAFEERAALPPTPFDRITQADANVADDKAKAAVAGMYQKLGVSDKETLRKAGYTEEEIASIQREVAAMPAPTDPAVTQDFRRTNGNGRAAIATR